jgi:flagellin-like hook-associated protein FlgL
LQQQLIQYANSIGPSGQYIFGGQSNDQKPFSISTTAGATSVALPSGTYLNFDGDNLDVTIETGPSDVMAVNSKGWDVFSKAYQALDQLKIDLQGGNIGSLSGVDIQQVQDSMNLVNTERGYIGTKLQSITALTEHYTRRIDDLKENVSDIEDVDLSDAIQKYTLAQTAYQAALSVASQGYKLSLMDFIA